MITFHGHSIVGSWTKRDKWRYRPRRKSEICPREWWQAPATIENICTFIQDPEAPTEDIPLAFARLEELNKHPRHVLDALHYKASATRAEGLHCEVKTQPSMDQMLMGAKPERPLEYLDGYVRKYKPFSQQLIGADFILKMKRCGIFYDMRVGKTLTATIALKYALEHGLIDHGIIVCPRILTESVWAKELEAQGLDVYILNGGKKYDDATLSYADADVYIMSYETLVGRMDIINCHLNPERIMVIADETSRIKNPTAKRTKAFHKLTYYTPYVAMLTGTPMEQGPQDIWSQMFAIDRGMRLFPTFGQFAGRYTYQEGNKFFIQPAMKLRLELSIQSGAMRYVRSEADQFAGKDKNFRWVQMPPSAEQAHATEQAINGFVQTLSGDFHEIVPHVLTLYGFLREICCGYNKVRLEELGPYCRFRFEYDAKTLWLETWLESNPGQPAVVFCEFDEHEQIISDMLERANIQHVWMKRDGKKDPAECVRKFNEGEVRVIIMKTTQAEGITLNRIPAVNKGIGSFPSIIYMAPTWSLGRFMQSQDRCVGTHNQRNIMTPIYCLITKGSIEEKIMKALRQKKNVQEAILRDAKRKGFTSFLDELRLTPEDKVGDSAFDAREMHSRKVLGLSPELKPTHVRIRKLCPALAYIGSYDIETTERYDEGSTARRIRAAQYLMDKYDERGVLLKPNTEDKPDYASDNEDNWEDG